MNVNLNNNCHFELTRYGEECLKNFYDNLYARYPDDVQERLDVFKEYNSKDGVYELPLWELMEIFGSKLYLGAQQVIKNNNIEIIEELK